MNTAQRTVFVLTCNIIISNRYYMNTIPLQNLSYSPAVIIQSGKTLAAVPLKQVVEILPACAISPGWNLPEHIRGVFNLHGNVLFVVDVAQIFDEQISPLHPEQHFVICKTTRGSAALLIDAVIDISTTLQYFELQTEMPGHTLSRFVVMDKQVLPLLDPSELLSGRFETLTNALHTTGLVQLQEQF